MSEINLQYAYYLWKTKNGRYKEFKIPKSKPGEFRTVYSPDEPLKAMQGILLREVLDNVPVADYLYAFEKGKRAKDMATLHSRAAFVLSWDIKDFFPGLKQRLVYRVFSRIFPVAPDGKDMARLYSELVTYKSFIPQGAVTSPKVANIVISNTFGPILEAYFSEVGGAFSVYADDITVSFPRVLGWSEVKAHTDRVELALKEFGLRVNRKKTKAMPFFKRQYVLGAVVNVKVNLPKEKRDRLRAAVHNLEVNGVTIEAEKYGMDEKVFVAHLTGRIQWYKQLNPEQGGRLYGKLQEVLENSNKEQCHITEVQ